MATPTRPGLNSGAFTRRTMLSGMLGTTALATLGACSGTSDEGSSGNGTTRLRMLVVEDPLLINGLNEIWKLYEASTDGRVSVQLEAVPFDELPNKVQTGVAGGAPWDIILADGPLLPNYHYHDVLAPIGEFFDSEDMAQWDDVLVQHATYGGEFYGPPVQQFSLALAYNRALLPSGVEPPTALGDAWTLDEAREVFEAATVRSSPDATPSVWGFWPHYSYNYPSDASLGVIRRSAGLRDSNTRQSMAEDGITFEGYLDTTEAITAMSWVIDMVRDGIIPVQALPDMFPQNAVAFAIAPSTILKQYVEANPGQEDQIGIAPLPVSPDGDPLTHIGSWHYGVLSSTQNREEAALAVRFAASAEGSRALYAQNGRQPANKLILPEADVFAEGGQLALYSEIVEQWGETRVKTPGYNVLDALHARATQDMFQGADVGETMHRLASEVQAELESYAGWND